jgi:hypothetical protein
MRMWWFSQVPVLLISGGLVGRGPWPWRVMGLLSATWESPPELS